MGRGNRLGGLAQSGGLCGGRRRSGPPRVLVAPLERSLLPGGRERVVLGGVGQLLGQSCLNAWERSAGPPPRFVKKYPASGAAQLWVPVCVSFMGRFYQSLKDKNAEFTPTSIEKELLKSCKEAKGKENRLCYYIGATSDAATKIVNEVSKPLSNHIPIEKICEKLKKKDSQICELKYDKQIDLSTVDLKKLRVKELKKILDDWGETCKGCAEKSDYIRKINELMPNYAPKAASSRTDL